MIGKYAFGVDMGAAGTSSSLMFSVRDANGNVRHYPCECNKTNAVLCRGCQELQKDMGLGGLRRDFKAESDDRKRIQQVLADLEALRCVPNTTKVSVDWIMPSDGMRWQTRGEQ